MKRISEDELQNMLKIAEYKGRQITSLTGMEQDVYELSSSEKVKKATSKAIHKLIHDSKGEQYKLMGRYDDETDTFEIESP